jgi:hypothetical protein
VKADVLPSPLGKVNNRCVAIDIGNFGAEIFFSMHALLKIGGMC